MLKRLLVCVLILTSALFSGAHATALGQSAPDLTLKDVQGQTLRLSDYRGRHVVLEWNNPGCPFVRKHYDSSHMQALQAEARGRGVVWLTVNSTADGSADFMTPAQMKRWLAEQKAAPSAALMDESGALGRAMGARSALHMFILNPRGELIYAGAIDSHPSARVEDLQTATNYVREGLNEALAGQPLSVATSRPYGCPITYR